MKKSLLVVALCLATGFIGFFLGGRRPAQTTAAEPASPTGPAIASFDGRVIDAAALRERIASEGPMAAGRFRSEAALKGYLQDWIQLEVLAAKGRAVGLDHDPQIEREQKRGLAELYVRKYFEQPEHAKTISDADARAYFAAHQAEFGHPEMFQVAHVLFKVGPNGSQNTERSRAQKALSALRKTLAKDPYAFENLARSESDDPLSRASGGRLAAMTKEQLAHQFGDAFSKAVTAQAGNPNSPPDLVESAQGYHIVKLLRREPAVEPNFQSVAAQIRSRLQVEKSQADYQAFIASLEQGAHVTIDDAAVRKFLTSGTNSR